MKLRISFENKYMQYFFWIPFFKAAYFSEWPLIDIFFDAWKVLSVLFIFVFYFKKKTFSKFSLVVCIYQIMTVINAVIHGNSISVKSIFLEVVPPLCVCLLSELCVNICFFRSAQVIQNIGIVCMVANLYTVLRYPGGMHNTLGVYYYWLLGSKNWQITYLFPFVVVTLLLMEKRQNWKIKDIMALLLAEITCFFNTSTTSLICMTILIALSFLIRDRFTNIINILTYSIVAFGMHFGVVFFRIQTLFSWLIEGILGKSVTFTSRTLLWDRMIALIIEKPFWGYGLLETTTRVRITGLWFAVHAHNQFLEVAFQGGLVLLAVWLIVLFLPVGNLYKYRNFASSRILATSIFAILLLFLTEYYSHTIFVFEVFLLAFHTEKIQKSIEDNECEL